MSLRSLVVLAGLCMLPLIGAAGDACAQGGTPTGQGPYYSLPQSRPRIQVNPRPLRYRRCVSWYELQYRPSGTVLYPAQHCWWVQG